MTPLDDRPAPRILISALSQASRDEGYTEGRIHGFVYGLIAALAIRWLLTGAW